MGRMAGSERAGGINMEDGEFQERSASGKKLIEQTEQIAAGAAERPEGIDDKDKYKYLIQGEPGWLSTSYSRAQQELFAQLISALHDSPASEGNTDILRKFPHAVELVKQQLRITAMSR